METKKTIDRVRNHVCGHPNYRDTSTLLKRNKLWTEECAKYLSQLLEKCVHCRVVDYPTLNRPVSLGSRSTEFNDTVAMNCFTLDPPVFHCMDIATLCSTGSAVPTMDTENTVEQLENCWMTQFWPHGEIQGDKAFEINYFLRCLQDNSIAFKSAPLRRHSKNPIGLKHCIP